MDIRSCSITADILNILTDGKKHTIAEIAQIVEVSEKTVRRHIQSLSYRYPITTFKGGIERGGVILEKQYIYQGRLRTKDEIDVIVEALKCYQKECSDVGKQNLIKSLIEEYRMDWTPVSPQISQFAGTPKNATRN